MYSAGAGLWGRLRVSRHAAGCQPRNDQRGARLLHRGFQRGPLPGLNELRDEIDRFVGQDGVDATRDNIIVLNRAKQVQMSNENKAARGVQLAGCESNPMATSLALRGIDKFFPTPGSPTPVQVLFDFSFEARPGEFVVFLGPSGCGKSTALRLIAGLEKPQAGDIVIDGRVVNNVPPARRRLAMVFQTYALFPHLSVTENILFGLKVRRVPKKERNQRLEKVAAQLELTDFLKRKPLQLSGGQRQRVALGRALVSGASLILMDEPLSNLDAKLRQQMRLELRDLQRKLGLTVIYVTHDQVEAMTMADQVVVMREGRVDQIADPWTLYRFPCRTDVARFIGSPPMNLIPCQVTKEGLQVTGSRHDIALDHRGLEYGRMVFLGVRPEDILLDQDEVGFDARLESVELLGADQLACLDIGADVPLIARVHTSVRLEERRRCRLGLRAEDFHLFDAGNGERIENFLDEAASSAFPGNSESTLR